VHNFKNTSLWVAMTLALAIPTSASASGASGASAKSGSAAKAKKSIGGSAAAARNAKSGSAATAPVDFGKRAGVGSQAAGSKALGSAAKSSNAAPAGSSATPLGSKAALTGSKAAPAGSRATPLGSKAALTGSKAAPIGSKAAAGLTLGSQAASTAAPAPTGSKAAPLGSRAAPLGSKAAPTGSLASGSRTAGSASAGSASAGRFRELVPQISGRLPRLSTKEPGLLFVLTDTSGSMGNPFAGQATIRKADAVADVVNGVLFDFVDRMNVGGEIKPRLDVALATYDGNGGIVSIKDLADNPADTIEVDDGEGNLIPRPIWVQPTAVGGTPMKAAFGQLSATVASWKRRPAGSHLVLGIHVTDGESTDGDPRDDVTALATKVSASGGKLLMTNIHLSESGTTGDAVIFPDASDAAKLDSYGQMLFEMSSPVPASLAEQLGTKPGARMMAYNATVEEFSKVFEAGSSVAAN
jgi:hypothetical protein